MDMEVSGVMGMEVMGMVVMVLIVTMVIKRATKRKSRGLVQMVARTTMEEVMSILSLRLSLIIGAQWYSIDEYIRLETKLASFGLPFRKWR